MTFFVESIFKKNILKMRVPCSCWLLKNDKFCETGLVCLKEDQTQYSTVQYSSTVVVVVVQTQYSIFFSPKKVEKSRSTVLFTK